LHSLGSHSRSKGGLRDVGGRPFSFAANAEVSNPRRCNQPGGSNVNTTSGPTKTTPRAIAIAVRRMIFPMAISLLRRSEFATTEEANLCSASHHVARFEPRLWLFLCRADARNKKIATSGRRRRRRKRRPERQANELFKALCLFHSGSLGRGEPICARQSQLHCGGNPSHPSLLFPD